VERASVFYKIPRLDDSRLGIVFSREVLTHRMRMNMIPEVYWQVKENRLDQRDLIPENCSIQNGSFVAKFEGGGHPG